MEKWREGRLKGLLFVASVYLEVNRMRPATGEFLDVPGGKSMDKFAFITRPTDENVYFRM
jgi:hypothetical protein